MHDLTGLDPVAKLTELHGDLYQLADYIADSLDADDYVLASVVHGDVYLCKPSDDDPYWHISAEVGAGETGAWDSESDQAARQFPDPVLLIDVFGSDVRYVVEGPYGDD